MLNKRSVRRINEAMDMMEEFINEAAETLEQAKIVALEVRKITGIPQYLDEYLVSLTTCSNRMDYVSNIFKAVRDPLAGGTIVKMKKRRDSNRQPGLVA